MNIKEMKAGDIREWLDQGPAVLLAKCELDSYPILIEDATEDVDMPTEMGWVINLLTTGEILTVHEETLDKNRNRND
jgi:hypothetical protein